MRRAAKDFELDGYKVPQGKLLMLPLKHLSARDGRWAAETGELSPDAFVPERMLTPEGQKTGDLLPFGYGPRWVVSVFAKGLCWCMCEDTCWLSQGCCRMRECTRWLLPASL
jgi:hypothetical protein